MHMFTMIIWYISGYELTTTDMLEKYIKNVCIDK